MSADRKQNDQDQTAEQPHVTQQIDQNKSHADAEQSLRELAQGGRSGGGILQPQYKGKNTPLELLLEFSKSLHRELREAVARNPNTPISILEQLAHDESQEVLWAVASNPNVPVSILEQLAQHDSWEVRWDVANRKAPISLLFKQLARDAWVSRKIASQIANQQYQCSEEESILDILAEESTSSLETILQRLAREGGEAARLFLARRFDLPADFLIQFAESNEVKVCEAVAQNPNTPVSCLENLARSPETKVREAVAQNPNTPIGILEQLSKDRNTAVLLHIAQKTHLSPEILEELASSKSAEVRKKVMVNPSLPKEAVERILCGEYATDYLKLHPDFFSRHPDRLAVVLDCYARSQFPLVSFIALKQPQISQELLQEKSVSISWLERLAVAQNAQATQQILIQLAQDSNQLVRAVAKDRLQHY
uniref:Leucine rich repeat variant n=1 Tax=Tolypothrix bouteillei VB521301 TaxID=1479485 RepID=A0A0C1QXN8_9CYAN